MLELLQQDPRVVDRAETESEVGCIGQGFSVTAETIDSVEERWAFQYALPANIADDECKRVRQKDSTERAV